ncbi:MAG TPA: hypothetical protein DCS87_13480 [Rheinheimera sp.]|nr:hypothetical protein [Rheinheimera sp.]
MPPRAKPTRTTATTAASPKPDLQNEQVQGTGDTHPTEPKSQTAKAVTSKKTAAKQAAGPVSAETGMGTVDTHSNAETLDTHSKAATKTKDTAATVAGSKKASPKKAATPGTVEGTVDTHQTKTNSTKQAASLRLAKAELKRLDWICQQLLATDHVDPRQQLLSKHEKMASNPFRFMRGSAGLFYADLQQGVLKLPASIAQWPLTMVQGDCHLSNLGLFTEEGSSGDLVKFGPNDFDDACIGHAGWDLLRLSLSFILAVRYCRAVQQGELDDAETRDALPKQALADDNDIRSALLQLQQSYRRTSMKIIEDPEVRYHAITDFDKDHVLKPLLKKAIARSLKGDKFWSHSSLAKQVDLNQLPLRFKDKPGKLQRPDATQLQVLREVFAPYAGDYIHDIVLRLGAGTGSLNMQRYYLLVGPAQITSKDDLTLCYLVEVKQQRSAAPLAFFSELSPMNRLSPAHLTVDCQRQMLRRPDLVLDELQWDGNHYLVRSLHHANVDIEPADVVSAKALWQYADACGQAMALVHNRGDRRSIRFAKAVAATPEQDWQQLVTNIWQYAAQQQRDCALLQQQLQQTRGRGVV